MLLRCCLVSTLVSYLGYYAYKERGGLGLPSFLLTSPHTPSFQSF